MTTKAILLLVVVFALVAVAAWLYYRHSKNPRRDVPAEYPPETPDRPGRTKL